MGKGKTVAKVVHDDKARLEFLNKNLNGGVTVIWECEIIKQLKENPEMKKAFDEYDDEGPIRIREAFFGGRTANARMHYEVPAGYKIKYFDFCSLYPFITATTKFPIGHPKVHVIKRAQQEVNWTIPEQIPVKGLLKVFLVPPRQVDVSAMPVHFDERLLFPLCRLCSLEYKEGAVIEDYRCPHFTDRERGWVSTCMYKELAASLESGYRVTKYFRSWEWEDFDNSIFTNYVAEMMQLKIHASGFPKGVDEELFMRECREKFGITIDREKMCPNPAKRIIAKLMNNNLWGRFSLRNNLCRTLVSNCPAEIREYLDNKRIEIVSIDKLNQKTVMITYTPVDEFVEENASSNLILSLWVTSCARLHLLRALQKVARTDGAVILYFDTDSVVFAYRDDLPCPLETGPLLGDLTDEFENFTLLEFVSGGCKNYALRMLDNRTGEEKTVLRVRGITLNGDVSKRLHFETFKRSVLNFVKIGNGEEIMEEDDDYNSPVDYPNFIQPNVKTGTVTSRPMRKNYRPIITKGIVTRGMIIKEFGSD
jgi:hypothetical protein